MNEKFKCHVTLKVVWGLIIIIIIIFYILFRMVPLTKLHHYTTPQREQLLIIQASSMLTYLTDNKVSLTLEVYIKGIIQYYENCISFFWWGKEVSISLMHACATRSVDISLNSTKMVAALPELSPWRQVSNIDETYVILMRLILQSFDIPLHITQMQRVFFGVRTWQSLAMRMV